MAADSPNGKGFVSYAQNFEDVILWRALKHIGRGSYVDIGAQDPVIDSVSLAFYEQGWRGTHVEPTAHYAEKLRSARPDELVVEAAIGCRTGEIEFFEIADTGLSTGDATIAREHEARGFAVRRIAVPCMRLSEILGAKEGRDVHWLKIDVEGMEEQVIDSWTSSPVRPWIVVVESTYPNATVPTFGAWEAKLVALGYEFVYFDGLNRFYISNDHPELKASFGAGPNVFDDFVLSGDANAPFCRKVIAEMTALRDQLAERAREADRLSQAPEVAAAEVGAQDTAFVLAAHAWERTSAALTDEIARKNEALATRAAEIAGLNERLAAVLESLQAARAETAAQTEAAAEAEHRVAMLRARLDATEARAARADRRTATAEDELLEIRADKQLLERRARQAARRLGEREALLEAVYRSHSWRVTAPLRAITRAFRGGSGPTVPLRPSLLPAPSAPTVFVECTHTYHSDLNTGIQRVVRNILRNADIVAARHGYAVVPVILEHGHFVCVDRGNVLADKLRMTTPAGHAYQAAPSGSPPSGSRLRARVHRVLWRSWRLFRQALATVLPFAGAQRFVLAPADRFGLAWSVLLPLRMTGVRKSPQRATGPVDRISLDQYIDCNGSILLLLDSSWPFPIWPAVERFKRRGGKVVGVIYDLIPITHPHTCVPELTGAFKAWLNEHFRHSDAFVGISRATANQVRAFSTELNAGRDGSRRRIPIDHFHLGSELDFVDLRDAVRYEITRIFEAGQPVFLMVGSFEPRKNHSYVLNAFDRFWQRGGIATLTMIGRHGWKTEAFLKRVSDHPQFGRQLFLLRDARDSELDYCYRTASALIISSEIEGFGLPVVEAFQRGLPVLCSDIPVFREIADGKATFFDLADCGHLTDALLQFCRTYNEQQRGARTPQPWINWRESTEQLYAAMMRALGQSAGSAVSGAGV